MTTVKLSIDKSGPQPIPVKLSTLTAGAHFFEHSFSSPEMNHLHAVLQNDGGVIYAVTNVSKDIKDPVEHKFIMVFDPKTGSIKHFQSDTLVHEVPKVNISYSK